MINDNLFFESHYDVLNSEILPYARNIASNSTVEILNIILKKLGISENDYEIRLTIPENGCYKDTIKIIWKRTEDFAKIIGALIVIYNQFYPNKYDETNKKLDLVVKARNLGVDCDTQEFQGILRDVCEDVDIKKALSRKYQALDKDKTLKSENIIVKKNNKILSDKKIKKSEFKNFDYIAEEKIYSEGFNDIIIELVSPVLKSDSKRLWIGIYQGETIKHNNIPILIEGETIYFYVQDNKFLQKIDDKEISFSQGDYIYTNIEVKGILNFDDNILKRRKILTKSVRKSKDEEIKKMQIAWTDRRIQELDLFKYANNKDNT